MNAFASRYLPISAFLLLLAGCQYEVKPYHDVTDSSVSSYRQIEQTLASGNLAQAERELKTQQALDPRDTRGQSLQLQLAEAYLGQGNRALQQGDVHTASTALEHARRLLPNANSASQALDDAIASKQLALLAEAEERQREALELAAQQAAERAQQLARQQAAALAQTQTQALAAAQAKAPVSVQRRPKLINPQAANSVIELPMLDQKDNDALRSLMDSVAHDVVTYNCAVRIEVREAKDFPWTAALLNARVKRLDPRFEPSMLQSIRPDQTPRLVLTPAR